MYQKDEYNHIFWKSVSNDDDGNNNADNNDYDHKVDVNDNSSHIGDKRTKNKQTWKFLRLSKKYHRRLIGTDLKP